MSIFQWGVLTCTSELRCCSTAPLRRVTVSLLSLFSTSRKTLEFSPLDLYWGFFSETEKTLMSFFISSLALCMSASLSNLKVSSTSVSWLSLQAENVSPRLSVSGWWMCNDPLDSLLCSPPATDFGGSSVGERDGDGSGFRPVLIWDSLTAWGTDTADWGSSTCRFIASSSRCSWTSILMLLTVARDAVLTLRASGEEAFSGNGVWTGVESVTLFCSLCLREFSSLWKKRNRNRGVV